MQKLNLWDSTHSTFKLFKAEQAVQEFSSTMPDAGGDALHVRGRHNLLALAYPVSKTMAATITVIIRQYF